MAQNTKSDIQNLGSFVWSIAEILRGDFKQSEYGKVVLPFVVLRRLDCILEETKADVLEAEKNLPDGVDDETRDMILFGAAGDKIRVYNTSRFTFETLKGQDPGQLHQNLVDYITKFSPNVRDIFLDKFLFTDQLKRLNDGGILWQVFERFCQIDLHPDTISNIEMGYLFEGLIRRFSEISNETAGEHFTPREVIRLIVDLLIANDQDALSGSGIIRTVYDPACGTGGMLALTEEAMINLNSKVRVELYGQELNPESFGICKSDMLVTGHNPEQIAYGNTLTNDAHAGRTFHYMLSNPPYGVDWKKYQDPIKAEAAEKGFEGRFGAGLPRVSDGQLLFLQHMISKMRDDEMGSRIGIVMNGSPLYSGDAGKGESEIRRWMLENDWIEAIIALPNDIFYNTGIQTFVWLLTNRKSPERRGKVQLLDASGEQFWQGLRKSLGSKRREIPEASRAQIVRIYSKMLNGQEGEDWSEVSKIFNIEDFGYREFKVERPLRLKFMLRKDLVENLKNSSAISKLNQDNAKRLVDLLKGLVPTEEFLDIDSFFDFVDTEIKRSGMHIKKNVLREILVKFGEKDPKANVVCDNRGQPQPDPSLRDYEYVPLDEDWQTFFEREVVPFAPDAWVDEKYLDEKDGALGKVGYQISFARYFYEYEAPRSVAEIDYDIDRMLHHIWEMHRESAQ